MRLSLFCLLALTAAQAVSSAQVRYHFGDDPRWSDPNFDDSAWPSGANGIPVRPGFLWMRTRVTVPDIPASKFAFFDANCPHESSLPVEYWVNGRFTGRVQSFPPHPSIAVTSRNCVFPIVPGAARAGDMAIIAQRLWIPAPDSGTVRFGSVLGTRDDLTRRMRLSIAESRWVRLPRIIEAPFYLLGMAVFGLWVATRKLRTLLWFGAWVTAFGALLIWEELPAILRPDWPLSAFMLGHACLVFLSVTFELQFVWAIFRIRRSFPLRVLQALTFAGYALAVAPFAHYSASRVMFLLDKLGACCSIAVFCAMMGVAGWQFYNRNRRPLAFALLLQFALVVVTYRYVGGWLSIPGTVTIGRFVILAQSPGHVLIIAAVAVILIRDFVRSWRHATELDAEFEAAREMQQALVPPAANAPGFRAESVYLPARHVGGDFFWTFPAIDGSLLLIAGDVSGKGLKSAMRVATLAGALRDWPVREPRRALEHLNQVLLEEKAAGLTTCCAVLFELDGRLAISNAGHIPPYLNGREMPVAASLPLGLTRDADYIEQQFQLAPGDRITLISDGVVEARNSEGELYGFDRTRELSASGSATQIAETARAFGQEDDITVITIERITEAAHAA